MNPNLVLCLGNEVLADDAFGFKVASRLEADASLVGLADVEFAPLAGFNLLDLLAGRLHVLVVDVMVTGKYKPGHLQFFPMGEQIATVGLVCSHQINLPLALRLGDLLGYKMPQTVEVLAVEALDVETISENLTAAVEAAFGEALKFIRVWAKSRAKEVGSFEVREGITIVAA